MGNKPVQKYESELIIGLAGTVGTDLSVIVKNMTQKLTNYGYKVEEIHISKTIIPFMEERDFEYKPPYERINSLMNAGDKCRKKYENNSILAMAAVAIINSLRTDNKPEERKAYIINQLKHPDEIKKLREVYSDGFYLIGVYCDKEERREYLIDNLAIDEKNADKLIGRDEYEECDYGQKTRDTFQLADFFINYNRKKPLKTENDLQRFIDIIFGHPYLTPIFDEFAMFMAFAGALRSADLSRQVGAVIANENNEIIASGANDCPKYGGGLYWPEYNNEGKIVDYEQGRDYKRGCDSNTLEKEKIIHDIVESISDEFDFNCDQKKILHNVIKKSKIDDITEYGRVVHAEMEALLFCARNHISTRGATLYCTTFPCHNCAKHIISAGIERVVYIEPYPKSKAALFHEDSISIGFSGESNKVQFESFVGVGPRKYFDLFSLNLGSGYPLLRKNDKGKRINWDHEHKHLRLKLTPDSYLERESSTFYHFKKLIEGE